MDLFPPTYDFPMDLDDGTVYTDIHVDPASLPVDPPADLAPVMEAPLAPFVLTDEEMEEEEDPEEDPEEEPQMDPTSDDDIAEPIQTDEESSEHAHSDNESLDHAQSDEDQSDPRSDDPTSPAAILPASPDTTPSAIEPEIAPHTTSTYQRLSGPRVTRTARMRVRFPSTNYASTSRASPPLSPSTDLYRNTPHPAYTPSPTPSPARMSLLSAPNQDLPASPRSPDPALFETTDPVISSLRDNAYAVGNRISQIERNLTEIPGPDSFNDLEGRVQQMGRRMDNMGGQVRAMERRLADQVRDLRLREGADRVEIHNLRRRLQILEDQLSGTHI